ncbi:ABC transporter ATP-binding protein [Georhizobium profundi]|uniref:ABC transporter ATP-binding protein n=1 Tax=Georhizobium profundi TaxID=2341112 RepID=A0A3Q8XRY3_9HYPH|nr:ABC transporter ATP-binding protein [Georhizobium profundi]AZN73881.1 ABC transporter ATP-binding protein [Georhizobium profundi]
MNAHVQFTAAHQRQPQTAPDVVTVQDVTLRYATERGTLTAAEDISFTIREGERFVLLGPSGCGKSSLLKSVAGFLPPASGSISIRGRAVERPGPDRMVVFQEFDQLLPWKTVIDNVAFPLRVAKKLDRAKARERARSALDKVGLSRALDVYPHTLSGGMKQRAAIARALAMESDILLMDEPFAALDALTRRTLQEDLLALVEELRLTLLFVTHSIEEAVLIGTDLHLLSAHPGRTIKTVHTSHLTLADEGTAAFDDLVGDVRRTLFAKPEGGDHG